MKELIEEIRKITADADDHGDEAIILQERNHASKTINKTDFRIIDPDNDKSDKICFIDGGNAEILSSPSFSLHLIRVYYCIYEDKKKISSKKYEFWSLAKPAFDSNLSYEINIIGSDLFNNKITFDPSDQTLKEGIHDANISKFGSIVRRFAELSVANQIAEERLAGMIVLDGNLQESIIGEDAYLSNLIDNCSKNMIRLASISKTNSILTNKGRSAAVLLNRLAPAGTWYCELSDKKHDKAPNICFAKLHPSSKHTFRVDFFDEAVFGSLAEHSKDPIFLGYPYGLVEADGHARIPNREKQMLRTMLMAKLGRGNDLATLLSSSDAHQILDKMQY